MTEKIYELKEGKNWFIGKWGEFDSLTSFDDSAKYYDLKRELEGLLTDEDGFHVHVISCDSEVRLISFIIDMIKSETGRSLEVKQHQGATIVLEDDLVKWIRLPKSGIAFSDLFATDSENTSAIGDTILIATRNEGKTKEFRRLFGDLGIAVENLNDYPDLPEVAETGMTFEENARLKAETISNLTGKMVLSDDSGLMVDVLGGLPGVWSARFAGEDATDEDNNAKLLHELAMVFEQKDRTAHFHTTLVVAAPEKESLVVEAEWPGYIGFAPKGENGFGYDPLFLVGETGRTSAELTAEDKNQQSHRGQAVKKLMEVFPSWQNAL